MHQCGRWAVARNTDGLSTESAERLRAPSCLGRPLKRLDDDELPPISVDCPGRADDRVGDPRMDRAGLEEINHWIWRDMCGESELFRALNGAYQTDNVTACRQELARREHHCETVDCVPCEPRCTQPFWQTVHNVLDCVSPTTSNAQIYCEMSTDQGRHLTAQHGGVPQYVFQEHFHSCVWNPLGRVARSAVSCRRPEPFAGQAVSIASEPARVGGGYMVPCRTDADCRNACPGHWLTGKDYVCMQNYSFYDYMQTYDHRDPEFKDVIGPLGAPEHTKFDVAPGSPGVCVRAPHLCPLPSPPNIAMTKSGPNAE